MGPRAGRNETNGKAGHSTLRLKNKGSKACCKTHRVWSSPLRMSTEM